MKLEALSIVAITIIACIKPEAVVSCLALVTVVMIVSLVTLRKA